MSLAVKVGLSPGHIVLDGDPAPPPLPQFLAHAYCARRAGWIKMPLGMEVGLDPSDIVFDGDSAPPPQRGHNPLPNFRPVYCGQMAAWIKMPLGMEVGLGPGHIVLDGDPSSPPKKGGTAPNFRPMSIVPKQLDGSGCHLVWR